MTHPLVFTAAQIDLDLRAHHILPDLAVELLIEGLDSPSLRLLAGESSAASRADLDSLLNRTLEELALTRG